MPDTPFNQDELRRRFLRGGVIPAHPLALNPQGRLDEKSQRALTRYYHAAGAAGVAVGVHTTQFEIRNPKHHLLKPVFQLASEEISRLDRVHGSESILIAGLCGPTEQALREASLAADLGCQAGLLSLAGWNDATDDQLLAHCRSVAEAIPLVGFYLQPSVGGRILSLDFWRNFVQIPRVIAIKIAPFHRYRTLDVIRAVAESGRAREIALYTGNDDNIAGDLLTEFSVATGPGQAEQVHFVGGLLGQWACWTRNAVELCSQWIQARKSGSIPANLLTIGGQLTETNAALFDAAHGFQGCIAGIQYVLHQQGLLSSPKTLNPREQLSPGQKKEIDRVRRLYPHLTDDDFVKDNLESWFH